MMVAAIILGIFALLLVCPVRVHATLFEGETRTVVRYLFLRFHFPSLREKKKREKAQRKKTPKKEKKKKQKKETEQEKPAIEWDAQRVGAVVELIKRVLTVLSNTASFLIRGVRFRDLKLEVLVVRGDAHKTAVESGKLNAILYGTLSLVQNYVRLENVYINVYPGFWAAKESVTFEAVVTFAPWRVAAAFLILFVRGFPILIEGMKVLQDPKQSAAAEEPAAPPIEDAAVRPR